MKRRRSLRALLCSLFLKFFFTCFITLKPHSASTKVPRMVGTKSNKMGRLGDRKLLFIIVRIMRIYWMTLVFMFREFVWDVLLLMVPAIMSLATGIRMVSDSNAPSYLILLCDSVTSIPMYTPWVLIGCSFIAICLGVFRFFVLRLRSQTAVNYYMLVIALLVTINITSGITTVVASVLIQNGAASNTLEQIETINPQFRKFDDHLKDAWDHIQIQLGCCGSTSYLDYITASASRSEPLPPSCCTVKWKNQLPHINNAVQCQLDAWLMVSHSIYINMPGCNLILTSWFQHYTYAQVFVMFITAQSHGMALAYIYIIYYRRLQRFQEQTDTNKNTGSKDRRRKSMKRPGQPV